MIATQDNIMGLLRHYEKEIQADAVSGMMEANQVILVYRMYQHHQDIPTLGVLMGAMDAWLNKTDPHQSVKR